MFIISHFSVYPGRVSHRDPWLKQLGDPDSTLTCGGSVLVGPHVSRDLTPRHKESYRHEIACLARICLLVPGSGSSTADLELIYRDPLVGTGCDYASRFAQTEARHSRLRSHFFPLSKRLLLGEGSLAGHIFLSRQLVHMNKAYVNHYHKTS